MSDRLGDILESVSGVRKSTSGNLASYKQGASVRKYGFEISDEEADALFRLPCHYCGFQKAERFNGIDRVDNSLGYLAGNVVPCCAFCNRAKGRVPVADFLNWLQWVRSGSTGQIEPQADHSGVAWTYGPSEPTDRPYLTETSNPHVDLRGLTPQEYVRRKVWGESVPETIAKASSQVFIPAQRVRPPKPKRKPKPIPILRAHNFKEESRRA